MVSLFSDFAPSYLGRANFQFPTSNFRLRATLEPKFMLTATTYLSHADLFHSSSLPAAAWRRAVFLFCQILSYFHSEHFTRRAATLVASAIPYYTDARLVLCKAQTAWSAYVAYNPLYAGRDRKPQAASRKPQAAGRKPQAASRA
jgi:hypothetical protein